MSIIMFAPKRQLCFDDEDGGDEDDDDEDDDDDDDFRRLQNMS